MNADGIRTWFRIAAVYDIVLGAAFLFAFEPIFRLFHMTLPDRAAYIQNSAAWAIVFGVGFWRVSVRPQLNRDLVFVGVLMKFCFSAIVFWYWLRGELPWPWVPLGAADLVFGVVFLAALRALPRPAAS
jgi:hypothetical protein